MKWIGYVLVGAVLAGLLGGCASFERRTREKGEVWKSLDAGTQERLKLGEIKVGDSEDMVYIALGTADEVKQLVSEKGAELTWIYNSYYQVFSGYYYTRYYRYTVYDPKTKTYRVYYMPEREPIYETRTEEKIRVRFLDGKVTAVTQAVEE